MSTPTHTSTKPKRQLNEFELISDPKSKSSKLGKGSFASVRLVREKKTNILYAMKIMNANPMKTSRSHIQNLQNEVYIHRSLDHPNIIKFHDYIQEGFNIYHVLELAQNGTLYNFLHKKKILTPNEVFQFFYQTCLAVQYIHNKDILHRDLKPENILLDKDQNIKLCDFGWAARNIREKRTTFCGTYEYMAPEIVKKRAYDYRVDIWSLGILLYELSHGEAPYKGRSLEEITDSLTRPTIKFAATVQNEVKDLVQKILKINPEERISLDEIMSHPWMKYHIGKQQMNNNMYKDLVPVRDVASKSTPNIDNAAIQSALQQEQKPQVFETYVYDDSINEYEPHNAPKINFKHPSISKANDLFNRHEPLTITVPRNVMTPVNMLERSVLENEPEYNMMPVCERSRSDRIQVPASATLPKPSNTYSQNFTDVKNLPSDSVGKRLYENDIMSPGFNTKINSIFAQMNSMTPVSSKKDGSTPNPLSARSPNQKEDFTSACQSASKVQYSEKSPIHGGENMQKPMTAKDIRQQLKFDVPQSPNENVSARTYADSAPKQNYNKQYINIYNPNLNDLSAKVGQMASPTYKLNFSQKSRVETAKASQNKHFCFDPQTPPAHRYYETSVKKNNLRAINETIGSISSRKQRSDEKSFANVVLNSAQKDEIVRRLNFDAAEYSSAKGVQSGALKNKENRVDMLLKNAGVFINIDKLQSHR